MKLYKYILGLALVAAGLTSCDQDNISAIYEPDSTLNNVSFVVDEQYTLTQDTEIEIPVAIRRSFAGEEYTATVTLDSTYCVVGTDTLSTNAVSLKNATVTFEKGENLAYATLVYTGMEKGVKYNGIIVLSDADVATADTTVVSQIAETTVSVKCDYNWIDLGEGFYSSPDWWEDEFKVEVQHAEGYNIYRIKDLFQNGYDIDFIIEGTDVYVESQPSWKHSTYGDIYLVGDAHDNMDGYAGTYDEATKVVTLTLYHYVPGVGGFGTFTDTLTMP